MEDKEKTQSNRVFLILAVILLLLSGILGWQLYEQKKANDQLAAEKAQLVVEKDELTSELDELLGKYATMEDENGQLSAELEEQRQLIEQLKADVEKHGKENFKREILHFCINKGSASYLEAKEQMLNEVLEYPDKWYNGIINCKVHRTHVKLHE